MPDLEQLVRTAAAGTTGGINPDALWRRARRQVWTTRLAIILIVAGLGTGAFWFLDASPGVIIGDNGSVEPADQQFSGQEPKEPYTLPMYGTVAVRAIDTFAFIGAVAADQEELRGLWDDIEPEGPPPALPQNAAAAVVGYESRGCADANDVQAVSLQVDAVVVHVFPGDRPAAQCRSTADRVIYVVAIPRDVARGRTARVGNATPPPEATAVPLPVVDEEQLRRLAITWLRAVAEGDERRALELSNPPHAETAIRMAQGQTAEWRYAHGVRGTPVVGRVFSVDGTIVVCAGLRAEGGTALLEAGVRMRATASVWPPAWRPSEYLGYQGCLGDEAMYGAFGAYEPRASTVPAVVGLLLAGVGLVVLIGDRQARRWAATHPSPRKARQDPGRDYPYTQTWRY